MDDPIENPASGSLPLPEPLEIKQVHVEVYAWDEADKRMLPCHNFIEGSCEKGITCVFYHPAPDDLATAINSPPFPEEFGAEEAVEAIVRDIGRLNTDTDNGGKRRRGRTGYIPRPERYGSHGRSAPMRSPPVHRQFSYRYRQDRSETCSLDRNISHWPNGARVTRPHHYVHPVEELEEPNQYIQHYLPPVQLEEIYIPPLMSVDSAFEEYDQTPYEDFGYQDPEYEVPFYDFESDTMFKHIEWTQFLAPGQLPPPIVAVPTQYDPPVRKQGRNFLEFMTTPPGEPLSEMGNVGCPILEQKPETSPPPSGKMSAKQELKFKLGLVAMELATATHKPEIEAQEIPVEEVIVSVPEFNEQSTNPVAVQ